MRSYVRPQMSVELFKGDIITTSLPVGCGAADNELPPLVDDGTDDFS